MKVSGWSGGRVPWHRSQPLTPSALLIALGGLLLVLSSPSAAAGQGRSESPLRHVRTIGAADGPLSFGVIGPVAVQDSLLAIVDSPTCEIAIVNVRSGRLVTRIGGCGGGPGEFGTILALAWMGDSIHVADRRGNAIHVLDRQGRLGRILRPQLGRMAVGTHHIGIADDTTFALGLILLAATSGREPDPDLAHSFVALVDRRTGVVRSRLIRDTEPSSLSPASNAGRTLPMCSFSGPGRGTIALLNPWRFAGTLVRLAHPARAHLEFSADVPGMKPVRNDQGGVRRTGFPSVACGNDLALFKWSQQSPSPGQQREGYLEIRDREGRALLQRRLAWADSGLFGIAAAAAGQRFYFATNQIFEHPVVLEYELSSPAADPRRTRPR